MGTLYIVSTPIGNMEDITLRAIKTLLSVDFIACEDTRRTGQLMNNLQKLIKTQELRIENVDLSKSAKLLSYYDEVELNKIPEFINYLTMGNSVALVSDAGTPLVADPGFKLVRECIKKGIKVVSIPGPSAVISALTVSGLPPNQFIFLGYLPPKHGDRIKILQGLNACFKAEQKINPTVIIYESPYRISNLLKDIATTCGDIEIAVARELTKVYEEIWRGKISEVTKMIVKVKGELVVLFKIDTQL